MCEEDTLNELRASIQNLRKLLFALEERVEKLERIETALRIIAARDHSHLSPNNG